MKDQSKNADLHTALTHAANLLTVNPSLAQQQAEEILKVVSDSVSAKHILAAALRLQGDAAKGLGIIGSVVDENADDANLLHEYALCLGAAGQGDASIDVLKKVLQIDPGHAAAWRSLGDQLNARGDALGSEEAYDKHLAASTHHPELIEAAEHMRKKFAGALPRSGTRISPRSPELRACAVATAALRRSPGRNRPLADCRTQQSQLPSAKRF